jgi:beta-glucosidase
VRAFEMFVEDPLLAGTLGVAWINGLQSRHVGSVAKHLVCNDTETARDSYDAIVDEATLREVYLLPFEMAARAGCAGLMAAYNKVGGTHCAENASC